MGRKRRQKIEGPFVPFMLDFGKGIVWRLLSSAERSVYMEMRMACQQQTYGDYSRKFSFPYAASAHSPATVSKALKRFVRFGILEIADSGGLYKNMSLYRLKENAWKEYQPTKAERQKLERDNHRRKAAQRRSRQRRVQAISEYRKRKRDEADLNFSE